MLHFCQDLSLMCESRDVIVYATVSFTCTNSFTLICRELEEYRGTAFINPIYSGPSVDQDRAVKEHKSVAYRPQLDFPHSTVWQLPLYSAHYDLSKALLV